MLNIPTGVLPLFATARTSRSWRISFARTARLGFKSGSFYRCVAEEGFSCGKYKGNAENLMNSVAIVESPATPGPDQKRYIVALLSNVLRVNSAWDHSRIGAALEELIRTRKPAEIRDQGSATQLKDAGASD
jgi:hypothetical protein